MLVELLKESLLLEERQDRHPPAQKRLAILAANIGRKVIVGRVEVLKREADLLEVIRRLGAAPRKLSFAKAGHQCRERDWHGRRRVQRRNRLARDEADSCVIDDQRMYRREKVRAQIIRVGHELDVERRRRG